MLIRTRVGKVEALEINGRGGNVLSRPMTEKGHESRTPVLSRSEHVLPLMLR